MHFLCNQRRRGRGEKKNLDSSKASLEKSGEKVILELYPWIKPLAVQFFSGGIRDEKIIEDLTYAPHSNRINFENNVSLLMKVREACIKSPLLWSKTQKNKLPYERKKLILDQVKDVETDLAGQKEIGRIEGMRNKISEKSDEILRTEAEVLASTLADRLPSKVHNNLMVLFEKYANVEILTPQPHGMRNIYNPLKKCMGPHIHLVASDLVDFLLIDVEGTLDESESNSIEKDSDTGSCSGDHRIQKSWKEWDLNRDALVKASIASYNAYHELHQVLTKDAKREKALKIQESKDEMELDSIIDQVTLNWEQKEENASKAKLKVRKKISLTFQCTMMNDKFGPFSRTDSANHSYFSLRPGNSVSGICPDLLPLLPETGKTILVDNLPIDITEEEIRSLYSRCGQVQSVRIFNLRPDLDPGELTPQQLRQKRKKTRLSGAQATKRRGRQITPVHALIQFKDEDGYQAATIDILRIFGMVIRRHPANSIPAYSLNSLYIENLPVETSIDLQDKLNALFHPDMDLFHDIGSNINSQPTSCTLEFPSFEVADYAYQLMKKNDFWSNDCIINWMKTPKDAMRYWRRENIDP